MKQKTAIWVVWFFSVIVVIGGPSLLTLIAPLWLPTPTQAHDPTLMTYYRTLTALMSQPTPTELPDNLILTGTVYDADLGLAAGIPDVYVSVTVCMPRSFGARTDSNGRYRLVIPSMYRCGTYGLSVGQMNCPVETHCQYGHYQETITDSALAASPHRDFPLHLIEPVFIRGTRGAPLPDKMS